MPTGSEPASIQDLRIALGGGGGVPGPDREHARVRG